MSYFLPSSSTCPRFQPTEHQRQRQLGHIRFGPVCPKDCKLNQNHIYQIIIAFHFLIIKCGCNSKVISFCCLNDDHRIGLASHLQRPNTETLRLYIQTENTVLLPPPAVSPSASKNNQLPERGQRKTIAFGRHNSGGLLIFERDGSASGVCDLETRLFIFCVIYLLENSVEWKYGMTRRNSITKQNTQTQIVITSNIWRVLPRDGVATSKGVESYVFVYALGKLRDWAEIGW